MNKIKLYLNKFKTNKIIIFSLFPFLFFILYLTLGIFIFKDYGISWDEQEQRRIGQIYSRYVYNGDQQLLIDYEKYHGGSFEMFLYLAEKCYKNSTSKDVFYLRHFLTFLTFYISSIFFYLILKKLFKNNHKLFPLIGTLFYIFHPRIFAHTFYNSKDIVFLSLFTITIYFSLLFFYNKKKWYAKYLLGIFLGILISIRNIGLFLLGIIIITFSIKILISYLNSKKQKNILFEPKKYFDEIVPLLITCIISTIICWPTLWNNPIYHFIQSIQEMKSYPWSRQNLFMGKYINANKNPWYYLPMWFIISTPINYLLLSLPGIYYIIKNIFLRQNKLIKINYNYLLILLCFFFPSITIIIMKPVLYDGWRHVFYIYSSFAIFIVFGLNQLKEWVKHFKHGEKVLFIILILSSIPTILFIIKNHPYQNVYFNKFAGKNYTIIKQKYEMDYWGLAYNEGFKFMLRENPNEIICFSGAGNNWKKLLPAKDQKRLKIYNKDICKDKPKYKITNFRFKKSNKTNKNENVVFSIIINNEPIMSVYKIN